MTQIQTLLKESMKKNQIETKFLTILSDFGYTPIEPNFLSKYNDFRAIEHQIEDDKLVKLTLRDGLVYTLRPDITSSILNTYVRYLADDDTLKVSYKASYIRQTESGYESKPQLGFESFGNVSLEEHINVLKTLLQTLKNPIKLVFNNPDIIRDLIDQYNIDMNTSSKLYNIIKLKQVSMLEGLNIDGALKTQLKTYMSRLYQVDSLDKTILEKMPYLKLFSDFDLYIDISLMPKYDYYNDLYVEGFIGQYPKAIVSGGKYDKRTKLYGNEKKAFGLSFDMDILSEEVSI